MKWGHCKHSCYLPQGMTSVVFLLQLSHTQSCPLRQIHCLLILYDDLQVLCEAALSCLSFSAHENLSLVLHPSTAPINRTLVFCIKTHWAL